MEKVDDIQKLMLHLLLDAGEAWKLVDNSDTQFARRAYIKSVFSTIEGTVWLLKQLCLENCQSLHLNGISHKSILTTAEYALLADEGYDLKSNGVPTVQSKFLRLPDNLRFAVNTVNRIFTIDGLFSTEIDIGVGTAKWDNFLCALAIRNRVTHPKELSSFTITDEEKALCDQVFEWFNQILNDFLKSIIHASEILKKREEIAFLKAVEANN